MAKPRIQPDVLVLGSHPCAYLAAALLKHQDVTALHATIPGESFVDRLVHINPALFDLHKLLNGIKKQLDLAPVYGLRFLADDGTAKSEHVGKSLAAYVTSFKPFRAAVI